MADGRQDNNYPLEHDFPHPIAAPYRAFSTAHGRTDKMAALLACADAASRSCAALLLAQTRGILLPPDLKEQLTLSLRYPTLERWSALVLGLARHLRHQEVFLAELPAAFITPEGRLTATGQALEDLSTLAQEVLNERTALVDAQRAQELLPDLVEPLGILLEGLSFLTRYPWSVFRQGQEGAGSDGRFQGLLIRWRGFRLDPIPVGVEFDPPVPGDQVLVLNENATQALALGPFAEVAVPRGQETDHLFLLAGLRNDKTLRLENFHSASFLARTSPAGGLEALLNTPATVDLRPDPQSVSRLQLRSRLIPESGMLDDRYDVDGFVGRGGMGVVYRATDRKKGGPVAIKVLYPDLSRTPHFARAFIETGSVLSALDCQELVPVYECGFSSSLQENRLVMKYMSGGSLAERLVHRELLPAREALGITVSVLQGLAAMHEQGIVHGDLHPGNILFDEEGNPSLSDFGIPTQQDRAGGKAQRTLERVQSMEYAAPEVLLGGASTQGADLYSVGMVLYEMLTGRLPSKTSPLPPSQFVFPVPLALDDWMLSVLSLLPEMRPRGAREMQGTLRTMLEDLGPEYAVDPSANAQQLAGHLGDVLSGHMERIEREYEESRKSGDMEGASRLLRMKVDALWDVGEKVHWMQELARLHFEELGDSGEAVALYRRCLEYAPDDPQVARELIDHYEHTEEWGELSGLLEELVQSAPSTEEKTKHLARLVEVALNETGILKDAASHLEDLVELTGARQEWVEQLVDLKVKIEDFEGAAEALENWISATESPERREQLLRRLASLHIEEMNDVEAGIKTYERLLALRPDDRQTLEALRKLYRLSLSFGRLANTLRTLLDQPGLTRDERVVLLVELGEVVSTYLYDNQEAESVWRQVLDLDPRQWIALTYLERIYLREGQGERYLEILEKKAAAAPDDESRALVLVQTASAKVKYFSDREAAGQLLEAARKIAPARPEVIEASQQYLEKYGRPQEKSGFYLDRLEGETQREQRLGLFWKLAQTFEKEMEDPRSALQVMKRAFREFRGDPAIRRELELLSLAGEAVEELLGFYLEELEEADGDEQAYLAGRLAQLTTAHLGSSSRAVELLQRGAELTTNRSALLNALTHQYRGLEDWPKLAVVLLHRVRGARAADRMILFAELSAVVREHLRRGPEGLAVLDQMMELLPRLEDNSSIRELKEVCRALDAWDRLSEIIHREIELEPDPTEKQRLRLQLAEVSLGRNEVDKVVDVLWEALEKDPRDDMVQDLLEKALGQKEDWEGLGNLYRRIIPLSSDIGRKMQFMERSAELEFTVFNRMDAAAELFRQLSVLQPEKTDHKLRLAETLKGLERYTELAWLYEQLVHELDTEGRRRVLREMADIYQEKLNNPDAAIQTLRHLVKLEPENEELFRHVHDVCLGEKRYETLLRLLADRSRTQAGETRVLTLVEMARLSAMDMGLLPPAKAYLDEALSLSPVNSAAYALFREILERQEDWKGLAVLMEQRLEALEEGTMEEQGHSSLGLELAQLYQQRLGRTVRATEVLESVLEKNPEDIQAALMAADLYASMGKWDKTAPLLILLKNARDQLDESRQEEFIYLSGITYEALLERTQAINAFKELLVRGYKAPEVKRRLASLLYLEDKHEEAQDLIAGLLEEGSLDLEATRELRSILADIHRRLGRMEKSEDYLLEQLAQRPNDKEILGRLVALKRDDGDDAGEAEFVRQLLDVETDPERRFTLLVRLGDVSRSLDDAGVGAVAAYRKSLEIRPDSVGVLIAIAEVHLKEKQFDQALEAFAQAEEAETDPARKTSLALTQGLLCSDLAGQPTKALVHLRRCLDRSPGNWDAFRAMEKILVSQGDWEGQKDLYQRILAGSTPLPEDVSYRLKVNLARILLEKFGETREAIQYLEQALELRPEDDDSRSLLASLHLQLGDNVDQAVDEYRRLLRENPRDVNLLRMLRKTLIKTKQYDQAWCVTGVLEVLSVSTDKDQAFYRKFLTPALKMKPRPIDAEVLRRLVLPLGEDWELSEILRIVFERLVDRLDVRSHKDLGLARKDLLNPEEFPVFDKLVQVMAEVLGLHHPLVFVKDGGGSIRKEGTYPTSLVVPRDALTNKKGKEIRFDLAYALTMLRPEYAATTVVDTAVLRSLVGNALKLCVPSLPEPAGDPKANADLRKTMEKALSPTDQEEIRRMASALRAKGSALSVKRWLAGAEKTASRMGLVMANDLEVAIQESRLFAGRLSGLSPDDIETDLLRYAIGERYAELREFLSMAINLNA